MTADVRVGVIGLGMMGRHHARIARTLDGVDLVGGVDPAGDRHMALDGRPLYSDLQALLAASIDAAVVAVPSDRHHNVAQELANAGVHALIEKPVADTLEAAISTREAFAGTGLVVAVGHVERFNPPMQAMKQRIAQGELGDIISISTRRVGPHPARIRDVGVVRDLATHDIDIVLWLGGRIESVKAEIAHRLDHAHEDLVSAIGRLDSGAVMSIEVNWLTPTKQREVTVLGDRGAFVADLLSADLTFFKNADVPMEWDSMARVKGVSEGDMVRYAIPKPEPLRIQFERFRDAINGIADAQIATLDEGVEVVRTTELLLNGGSP